MSVTKFIEAVNQQILPLVNSFTGGKIYGLAQSMTREAGGVKELLPALVDKEGEGKYVGVDDNSPVIIYHKSNSVTAAEKQNSGVGDLRAWQVYTYSNTMIVFLDRKKTNLLPDEFILFLQANIADGLKVQNYKTVIMRFQNIILNTQQVFASEYQNTQYKVNPGMSLFAINYQIESTFDTRCFDKCP